MGIAIVPDIDAIGTGYLLNHAAHLEAQEQQQLYAGDYSRFLPPRDSIDTGRKLLRDNELMTMPIYQGASDFLGHVVISEMPQATSDNQGALDWYQSNLRMLDRALRRAAKYWSITDLAVLAAEPGIVRAYPPESYIRVGELEAPDAQVGHIIVQRYKSTTAFPLNQPGNRETVIGADRCRVIRLYEGRSDVQDFRLEGLQIGNPITVRRSSPISYIATAGDGDSWYQGTGPLAARIMIETSLLLSDVNRHRNKVEILPSNIVAAMRASVENGAGMTPTALRALLDSSVRPVAAADDLGNAPADRMPLSLDSQFELVRMLIDWFLMRSGLTPANWGQGIGSNTSGISIENRQTSAAVRARAVRRDIAEALPLLCMAAGMPPGGGTAFFWAESPFENQTAKDDSLLKFFDRGLMAASEVRQAKGMSPDMPTDGQTAQPSQG